MIYSRGILLNILEFKLEKLINTIVMKIELFKKPSENSVAVILTFVLFFLFFLLKVQENQDNAMNKVISSSSIEIASASSLID